MSNGVSSKTPEEAPSPRSKFACRAGHPCSRERAGWHRECSGWILTSLPLQLGLCCRLQALLFIMPQGTATHIAIRSSKFTYVMFKVRRSLLVVSILCLLPLSPVRNGAVQRGYHVIDAVYSAVRLVYKRSDACSVQMSNSDMHHLCSNLHIVHTTSILSPDPSLDAIADTIPS